jgi:DNA-binding transcriptional LysR family regulator
MILDKKMQVFLAVAEANSFSRAARRMGLSQSAVSFHVDSLETELGVSLFHRRGRTIALTDEGELLYSEGRKLAQQARSLEDAFSDHSASIAQRIHLAGDTLSCAFAVPWDLAAFQGAHPDVRFSFQRYSQESLLEKLLSGELDLAFVGNPVRNRKLATQVCVDDEIILVSAPEEGPDSIQVNDLQDVRLLWATGDRGLELLLSQKLSEAGLPLWKLNVLMEVEDLPILRTFVRVGVGMAFLPRLTVADELRYGMLKEIVVEGLHLERQTYLVYRKRKHPREMVRNFLEFMQERRLEETSAKQVQDAR